MKQKLAIFRVSLPEGQSKAAIYSELLHLIVPAGIEFLLLQLVNMFDQIQVGVVGTYATSGVGMVNQIKLLFMTAFVAINIGVTALVARAKGRGEPALAKDILRHGLLLTCAISGVCAIFAAVFAEQLLLLIGAPDERSFAEGLVYFQICILSFVPAAITSTITAALRGLGNTKAPLYYSVAANVTNVFLNWVLINGRLGFPRLGVKGAAIATVIGLMVSFVLSCRVLVTDRFDLKLPLSGMLRNLKKDCFGDILGIGVPSMIEQLIVRIGLTTFTKIVSTLGTGLYATHTICLNIQYLTYMNGMAFSVASTTKAGQCLGAKREDLAAVYSQYCARLCCLFSLLLAAAYAFGGGALISLYNQDPSIIAAGITPLRLMALMQPLSALQYVFSGAIRGAGDTKYIAAVTIGTTFIIRPLVAYLLVITLGVGLNGAWMAMVADQALCSLLICMRFRSGKWLYAYRDRRAEGNAAGHGVPD